MGEQLKFCKDCKHFFESHFYWAGKPDYICGMAAEHSKGYSIGHDLVTGDSYVNFSDDKGFNKIVTLREHPIRCENQRVVGGLCGVDGSLYEAKQ